MLFPCLCIANLPRSLTAHWGHFTAQVFVRTSLTVSPTGSALSLSQDQLPKQKNTIYGRGEFHHYCLGQMPCSLSLNFLTYKIGSSFYKPSAPCGSSPNCIFLHGYSSQKNYVEKMHKFVVTKTNSPTATTIFLYCRLLSLCHHANV